MSGAFQRTSFQGSAYQVDVVTSTASAQDSFGSKGRKKRKVRGPYSDPLIFEQYLQRCIAEREQPRLNRSAALLKETLVQEVEARQGLGVLSPDALLREQQTLDALRSTAPTERDVSAIESRMRQIQTQIKAIEEDELAMVGAVAAYLLEQ